MSETNPAGAPVSRLRSIWNRIYSTTYTFGHFVANKAVAIIIFFIQLHIFINIPPVKIDEETGQKISGGMPLSEVFYVLILINGALIVAPAVRLLVFPEASDYAEQGWLRKDLDAGNKTPSLLHYWYATGISYALTIACFATLNH